MANDEDNNVTNLREIRKQKFLDWLKPGMPLVEGYRPAEALVEWYRTGDGCYSLDEMLHAMAYSAAAQIFRELGPDEGESLVRETFELIVSDLTAHGPHYGHEEY